MIRQGGRSARPTAPSASPYPHLKPLLAASQTGITESFHTMARELASLGSPVRLHVRLLDGEKVEHWEIEANAEKSAARRDKPKDADVHLALATDTWIQIAQGQLAPFDALFAGRLRVGGDLELAKRIARHLSDPAVPFVPPC